MMPKKTAGNIAVTGEITILFFAGLKQESAARQESHHPPCPPPQDDKVSSHTTSLQKNTVLTFISCGWAELKYS